MRAPAVAEVADMAQLNAALEEHRVPLKVPAAAKGNSDHAVLASLRSGAACACSA